MAKRRRRLWAEPFATSLIQILALRSNTTPKGSTAYLTAQVLSSASDVPSCPQSSRALSCFFSFGSLPASRTLASRPEMDPKDLYSYMLHSSEKRSFIQRDDVGAIDKNGTPVLPENLCAVFRAGVIIRADVSLRQYVPHFNPTLKHFILTTSPSYCINSSDGKSNTFPLYMCGMQALGHAYEVMPQERSAPPGLISPKSGKRKAADDIFSNAPAKRRLVFQSKPVHSLCSFIHDAGLIPIYA